MKLGSACCCDGFDDDSSPACCGLCADDDGEGCAPPEDLDARHCSQWLACRVSSSTALSSHCGPGAAPERSL